MPLLNLYGKCWRARNLNWHSTTSWWLHERAWIRLSGRILFHFHRIKMPKIGRRGIQSKEREKEVSASCCCCCWNVGQQAILKSVCEREKTLCRESCRHRQSTKCNWRATGLIDRGRHSFRHDRSIENTFINKRCRELEMANGHENKQRTYQDLCVPIISTPRPNLINVRNNKHITRQQLWIKETNGGHKKK